MTKEQFLRELLWHWERMPELSLGELLDKSLPLIYRLGEITDDQLIDGVREYHEEFSSAQ